MNFTGVISDVVQQADDLRITEDKQQIQGDKIHLQAGHTH